MSRRGRSEGLMASVWVLEPIEPGSAAVDWPSAEESEVDDEDEANGDAEPKPRLRLRPLALRALFLNGGGGTGAQDGGGMRADVEDSRRLGAEGDRWRCRLVAWSDSLRASGAGRLR